MTFEEIYKKVRDSYDEEMSVVGYPKTYESYHLGRVAIYKKIMDMMRHHEEWRYKKGLLDKELHDKIHDEFLREIQDREVYDKEYEDG